MGGKKLGRPTDNPKEISLKVRLDQGTTDRLDKCVQNLNISKAEVVRRGIHRIYEDLEKA